MDKQIEEMTNDLQEAWTAWSLSVDLPQPWEFVAKILAKKWQPKIPEGAVVLTEEEYEKIYEQAEATVLSNIADGGTSCHWCMNKHEGIGYKKGSKETVEKFAEMLKKKISSIIIELKANWATKEVEGFEKDVHELTCNCILNTLNTVKDITIDEICKELADE